MIADLRVHGVDRVEFVVGFSAPFAFWVWLGTRADGERDALATRSGLDGDVGRLARTAGLGLLYLGVEVESQETVDRDYEGNWFYRLR